jgi:hypothetical protein
MKILIVSMAFPPLNTPGALRPFSWAKYWTRAGHQVVVLTCRKEGSECDFNSPAFNSLDSPFEVCEVDYRARRSRPGTGKIGEKSNGLMDKVKQFSSQHYRIRLLFGMFFDPYILFIPTAVKSGLQLAQRHDFDVMISTFGPKTSHWIASILKQKLKIPWVADFRDGWSAQAEQQETIRWPFSPLDNLVEKKTIDHADLIMTVSNPLRNWFAEKYDIPCVTVENGFDPEEFDCLNQKKLYPDDGKCRFVYTGAIYGQRNPAPFFAAIQQLIKEGKISPGRMEIIFYGRTLELIRKLAQTYGIDDLVKTCGLVDRATALRAQRDADGLLLLEGEYSKMDGVLTTKNFEYLKNGKPILGIGMTEKSTLGQLMVEAGLGFPLGRDVKEIKGFIYHNFILNKTPYTNPNWEFINSFSRELLAQKALYYLDDIRRH